MYSSSFLCGVVEQQISCVETSPEQCDSNPFSCVNKYPQLVIFTLLFMLLCYLLHFRSVLFSYTMVTFMFKN